MEAFIRACLNRRLKETITAHGNIGWEEEVAQIRDWTAWQWTKEELERAQELNQQLPKIEMGHYSYRPGWAENISFPVIIKRTFVPYEKLTRKQKAELEKQGKDARQGLWKHYAVLSLMGLHPRTLQEILVFHNGRGDMENMLREGKLSYDLRHFPTKKMLANHAYAALGLIAHNFFRFIAIQTNPEHPCFAKKLRRQFIFVPGKLVHRHRKRILRLPQPTLEEVRRKQAWQSKPDTAISTDLNSG